MNTNDIKNRLKLIFQKMNLEPPASDDAPLALDSLALMMFIYETENACSVKFGVNDLNTELSLEKLAGLIASKK